MLGWMTDRAGEGFFNGHGNLIRGFGWLNRIGGQMFG